MLRGRVARLLLPLTPARLDLLHPMGEYPSPGRLYTPQGRAVLQVSTSIWVQTVI